MRGSDKGEVVIDVAVTDADGAAPVAAAMTWAWVPRARRPKP